MNALSTDQPQREATPEERKRSVRLFWLILLLFPMLVGAMVAYLSVKGRQVRDYGAEVLQQVTTLPAPPRGSVPCTEVLKTPPPADAKSCTVSAQPGGKWRVVIEVEGNRRYQLER